MVQYLSCLLPSCTSSCHSAPPWPAVAASHQSQRGPSSKSQGRAARRACKWRTFFSKFEVVHIWKTMEDLLVLGWEWSSLTYNKHQKRLLWVMQQNWGTPAVPAAKNPACLTLWHKLAWSQKLPLPICCGLLKDARRGNRNEWAYGRLWFAASLKKHMQIT